MQLNPDLNVLTIVLPVAMAIAFIFVMSLLKEPSRRNFMAIFLAGAGVWCFAGAASPWKVLRGRNARLA